MKTLTSRLFLAFLFLLLCSAASPGGQSSADAGVPKGWKRVDAGGFFTFYLPPHAWDTGFSGTDEFYREYRVGKMRLMFVHRPMSVLAYDKREQQFGRGFQERVVELAGRRAYLFDYVQNEKGRKRYYTDLYVGDFPRGEVKLWMQADSWRPADLEIAKRIFRTVEFLRP
ncbi:MAG TPA: hypothetical protein VF723_04960 [Pyrinomonadaceae bacterium]|jgi:hypothetical protein